VRVSPSPAVEIENLSVTAPPPPVHLLLPIADKDRMLWLAEKACELGATSWRPVLFRRSRSVKPRGEGPTFNLKVKGRMGSALEQSGGHWLPTLFPESTASRVASALPQGGTRIVLDREGVPVAALAVAAPVTIAVGPEGGLEPEELRELEGAGFVRASVGHATLRFETAAVAGLAVVRSLLQAHAPHG
jgi:16S rRNA (uracil1498-N3)-methyltransferase